VLVLQATIHRVELAGKEEDYSSFVLPVLGHLDTKLVEYTDGSYYKILSDTPLPITYFRNLAGYPKGSCLS